MKSLLLCLILLASFSLHARVFTVLTYNAENIFDTRHDEGKIDWAYLPKAFKDSDWQVQMYCSTLYGYRKGECYNMDWNQNVYLTKIHNISRVIRNSNQGYGADIVILQEIENYSVMRDLAAIGLAGMGYNYYTLLEGPDYRGIDVGILSRYPIVSQYLHTIDLSDYTSHGKPKQTRGILEATIDIAGQPVTFLGNHWPSQGTKDPEVRMRAARKLLEAARAKGHPVIATGDFNTVDDERPHAIWDLAANPNQNGFFIDAFRMSGKTHLLGSHNYKGHWSFLDRILVFNLGIEHNDIQPLWNSFDVNAPAFVMKNSHGKPVPHRFDARSKTGYSDHLGLQMAFELL